MTAGEAEQAYVEARGREGRLLPDDIVRDLPSSGVRTPHAAEWAVRARSMRRVLRILKQYGRPLRILDVGCGNGWLSARLAEAGHDVTGLDTNTLELEQAARVFAHRSITWINGDPWSSELPAKAFDTILFAASFQYFPDPRTLFLRCRELLKEGGTILIVDTHIYPDDHAAAAARARSNAHYSSIGTPDMASYYHHHTRQSLMSATTGAEVDIRSSRSPLVAFVLGRIPFPLVRIRW